MCHLPYFILAYVAERKGRLAMCLEVGCQRHTISTFEKLYKAGKFAGDQDFIDITMPYLAAIKADLKRIKTEAQL